MSLEQAVIAARQRLNMRTGKDKIKDEKASDILAKAARQTAFERRHTALTLVELLGGAARERRLEARRHGLWQRTRSDIAQASGFILCERVINRTPPDGGYLLDINGLLLDSHADMYLYRASFRKRKLPISIQTSQGLDAWGQLGYRLDHSVGTALLADISTINLLEDPATLEPKLGSVIAPLSLEDLLAGLAVRRAVDEQLLLRADVPSAAAS